MAELDCQNSYYFRKLDVQFLVIDYLLLGSECDLKCFSEKISNKLYLYFEAHLWDLLIQKLGTGLDPALNCVAPCLNSTLPHLGNILIYNHIEATICNPVHLSNTGFVPLMGKGDAIVCLTINNTLNILFFFNSFQEIGALMSHHCAACSIRCWEICGIFHNRTTELQWRVNALFERR